MGNLKDKIKTAGLAGGAILFLGLNVVAYNLNDDLAEASCRAIESLEGREEAIRIAKNQLEITNNIFPELFGGKSREGYIRYINYASNNPK